MDFRQVRNKQKLGIPRARKREDFFKLIRLRTFEFSIAISDAEFRFPEFEISCVSFIKSAYSWMRVRTRNSCDTAAL